MFKKTMITVSLCSMLGGGFAASLPQVNIVANKGVTPIKPTENTVTYNYESANPLQLVSYHNSTIAYNQGVAAVQYNAQNDIVADDHGNTLSYDAMGEMISFSNSQTNQQVAYQYDVESHQSAERVEDAKGSSQTSQVFYYSSADQAQLIAESDSDGNQLSYLFAENKIGSINNTDQASLYITDQAGSVIALASNSGITHQYLYSPYGIMTDMDQSTTKAKNAQGFDGQRTDEATGYQFLGNGYRAYNPILHRFMQMDDIRYSPFGKGGINGYVFGNNNPVMNFDPTGHWSGLDTFNAIFAGLSLLILDIPGIALSAPPLIRSIVKNIRQRPEGSAGDQLNLYLSVVCMFFLGYGVVSTIKESGSIIFGRVADLTAGNRSYDVNKEIVGKVTVQYVDNQAISNLPMEVQNLINNPEYADPITLESLNGNGLIEGESLKKAAITCNRLYDGDPHYYIYRKSDIDRLIEESDNKVASDPFTRSSLIMVNFSTKWGYIPSVNSRNEFGILILVPASAAASFFWGLIAGVD